jgi:2-haloacid dehalogenase
MRLGYTTVLFDLDHTLLDSGASEQAAFDETMRSIDVEPSAPIFAIYDRVNQALWRQVEAGLVSPNDVKVQRFEQLLIELSVDGDAVAMGATFVQGLTNYGELFAGARELLDALHGRVRMGMITNGIGSTQRGRIDRLDLGHYFDAVSISGELGISKPDPQIFDHTLVAMQVADRSEVVMVGDSLPSDIAGAANAGIDSIWYNPTGEPSNGIAPSLTVETFDELISLL